MRASKRLLVKGLLLLFCGVWATWCGALATWAEELKILAVVNDEVITQADFDRAFLPIYLQLTSSHSPEELAASLEELKNGVLEQLIDERLMLQAARNPKPVEVSKGRIGTPPPIEVRDSEVEEMLAEVASRFGSPEEMASALSEQGLTVEDLKARFRDQVTIQKLIHREIRSRVTVSPAEVTAYYEAHQEEFQKPPAVQSAVIVIRPEDPKDTPRAKALAESLRAQVLQGASFYELASRYSEGPNPKMGGRLGFLEKGKTLPEIDRALFTLKAGELSPVIETPLGFHLFLVESVRPAHQAALEEIQGQIQERLFQQKVAAQYREWIERLKSSAYISIK